MTDLDPGGRVVQIGRVRLRTAGLRGSATLQPPSVAGTRGPGMSTEDLDAALGAEDVEVQQTVEIRGAREVTSPGGPRTRGTPSGPPVIELQVPAPGDDWGQAVLAFDEAGVATWHFARDDAGAVVTRGGGERIYRIDGRVAPVPASGATRGLIGLAGTKLLKVVVFPLLDPLVGKVGERFVQSWEHRNRPYGVRTFTPQDFRSAGGTVLDPPAWHRLSAGRALLLVHGTFSTAHGAFGSLPPAYVERLHALYGGRVLALDHPTLSADPRENVEWFLGAMPDGVRLDLDILCHSRGGLVARTLAEKQAELSAGNVVVSVRRVVFVASPNDGTPLTDTTRLGDFVDTYTNLVNFFPDTVTLGVLQGVLAVVKQLAVDVASGLAGLESMLRDGRFLRDWLNTGPRDAKQYFAMASDYDPVDPGLKAFVVNRLADAVFGGANDLVVPTASVHERNGSGFFPIEDRFSFAPADGVSHSGYFANEAARERIYGWLAG